MDKELTIILLVSVLMSSVNSARILGVFPTPSISHQVVFRPLMKELVKRGHEVIVLTPDPEFPKNGRSLKNLTEIDVHDVSYNMWNEVFVSRINGALSNMDIVTIGIGAINDIFEIQLNTKEFRNIIESGTKFDLIFVEALSRTTLIMSEVFKAPVIQFSSFFAIHPNYPAHGSLGHPFIYGECVREKLFNLSLWDKIRELGTELRYRHMLWKLEEKENAVIKRSFGPDAPTVQELLTRTELLFLNVNPIFEGNRAVPPGVIHLGGLHQKPFKELPSDLKSYLDASKHGVIYMSFGTNVDPSQLPSEKIQVFCRVFSRLPYDVLWKWNADELQGKPNNVRISKWLPQSDLLRHPKIKLFITQGGLQSTDEAITAGVPLLTFPLLGDQWYNAEHHVRLKIGLKIELSEVDDAILENGVKTVIEDPSFRANIKKLGDLYKDQPQTPLERAVWWTEYVLRHKTAKHLRSPMANITWTEYLMLDVVAVVLTILIVSLFIMLRIMRLICKLFNTAIKLKTL